MGKVSTVFFSCAFFMTLKGCGQLGEVTSTPPSQTPVLPAPPTSGHSQKTAVKLALTVPPSPVAKNCIASQDIGDPENVLSEFVLDGDTADWDQALPVGTDPSGDSPDNDITQVYLALTSSDPQSVVGLVKRTNQSPNAEIRIEFLLRDDLQSALPHQVYRIKDGHLEKYDRASQSYLPEDPSRGLAISKAEAVEFQIPKHFLDGAYLRQTWAVRVKSLKSDSVDVDDVLGVMEFVGNVPPAAKPDYSNCLVSKLTDSPMTFSQITAPDVDVDVAKNLLGIARNAFETVYVAFNRPNLHVAQLPVKVTNDTSFQWSNLELVHLYDEIPLDELRLPAGLYADESIIYERDKVILAEAIGRYVQLFVARAYESQSIHLRQIMSTIISDHIIRRRLGDSFWLVKAGEDNERFIRDSHASSSMSLLEYNAEIMSGQFTEEQAAGYLSMTKAFGHLISQYLDERQFLKLLDILAHEPAYSPGDSERRFMELLLSKLPDSAAQLLSHCEQGWLVPGAFNDLCKPLILQDTDSDGLADYLEQKIGSQTNAKDTDDDGWSDFGEFLVGKNPLSKASRPEMIVADGYFGDWQALLPNKVSVDAGVVSNKCPNVADIVHYAGLLDAGRLVVAARARDVWNSEPKVHWEVLIEVFGTQGLRRFTLRSVSGSSDFEVYDTDSGDLLKIVRGIVPMAHDVIEWVIDFGVQGLGLAEISKESVRYRIQLLFERTERLICDDTAWTQPLMEP